MKPFRLRLTAHEFERQNVGGLSTISTVLFQHKAQIIVEVASFEAATAALNAFGAAHAPCNVWPSLPRDQRQPRGYNAWNPANTAENIFEVATDVNVVDDHCGECGEFESDCVCVDDEPRDTSDAWTGGFAENH